MRTSRGDGAPDINWYSRGSPFSCVCFLALGSFSVRFASKIASRLIRSCRPASIRSSDFHSRFSRNRSTSQVQAI